MVDLDGDLPTPGDDVVLFGPGHAGEPTAQDWAEVLDTINYEIVTRVGGRFVRRHVDAGARMSCARPHSRSACRGRPGRRGLAVGVAGSSPSAAA